MTRKKYCGGISAAILEEVIPVPGTLLTRCFQAISSLALTMEMYLVDYIRTGSLIIAFFALLFVDRRLWITVDAVLSFAVGGALVVAPQYILDFQVCRTRPSNVNVGAYYIWYAFIGQ